MNKDTIIQFIKFVIVGFLNTAVDFAVLNILMYVTGHSTGIYFSFFKGTSFLAAVTNSYFMNKLWTFRSTNNNAGESIKFLLVSLIGFLINVGTASLVVNFLGIYLKINPILLANIGALSATAVSLVWNFLGFKLIVFKK